MNDLKNSISISRIYQNIISLFRRHPVLVIPFFLSIVADIVLLSLILLAPRYPFSLVIGSAIKAFWGEGFLHYPANLFLVPKLFTYSRYVFSLLFGILFTGMAVSLVQQAYAQERPSLWKGIQKSFKRYTRMFVIWVVTVVSMILFMKVPIIIPEISRFPLIVFALKFFINIGVQMVFLCAVPAVIIENKKIPDAIMRGLGMLKQHTTPLFICVLIPSLLFIPLTIIKINLPLLIDLYTPEIIILVMIARILVTALIDLLVTSAAAIILLKHREMNDGVIR